MNTLVTGWTNEEILKLSLIKGLNPTLQKKIIENYKNFDAFLNSDHTESINGILNNNGLFDDGQQLNDQLDFQLETMHKHNIKTVTLNDEKYPYLLSKISQPPIILFYKGELQESEAVAIAVVGTRKCTVYGKLVAEKFSTFFSQNNVIVVSGLAYGIDTISQMSVVKAGGITYGVLASGLDKPTSSNVAKNSEKIIDSGGAILSQFKCGVKAVPAFFLHRNRIIAGLSKATLVVESDYKGGSLNTAKHAIQEGRELFAVPGSILSKKSHGTNKLINDSQAAVAISPEYILKTIGLTGELQFEEKEEVKLEDPSEKAIYEELTYEPVHVDELTDKLDIDISIILVKLLELEFRGIVKQLPGKNYIRAL